LFVVCLVIVLLLIHNLFATLATSRTRVISDEAAVTVGALRC
jgi:hypothetical protein